MGKTYLATELHSCVEEAGLAADYALVNLPLPTIACDGEIRVDTADKQPVSVSAKFPI